jgi:hypothetical protein
LPLGWTLDYFVGFHDGSLRLNFFLNHEFLVTRKRPIKGEGESMICTRQELLEAIKKTLEQATPEEKQQMRDALLECLGGDRCSICGRRRMTLLLDTTSGRLQCFQCGGRVGSAPVIVREPGDLTNEDWHFLRSMGVLWGD